MLPMLDETTLTRLLERSLRHGGEFADVFCERRIVRSFRLQDGRIHETSIGVTAGVGIRVIAGESSGYAFSDELEEEALLRAADAASLIARTSRGGTVRIEPLKSIATADWYRIATHPSGEERFVRLLERADIAARGFDSRVASVNAHVSEELQEVWIAASDGRLVYDRRPMVALGVQAVAGNGRERGSGFAGDGGRTSLAYFDEHTPEALASEAARVATVNLTAISAPAGEMEMVVGNGGGGVLLHEAVGHGLESDFNRRGTSLYSGRVGERVASELVTIYDDANLPEERGSLNVDDEGTPGQHKALVENGILRSYMQDRLNAGLMGVASTGSGTAAVVPASAVATDVQHLYAGRRVVGRRNRRVDQARHLCKVVCRRPSGNRQRRFRVHGRRGIFDRERQDHRTGEKRNHRRQRARSDDEGCRGRQRLPFGAQALHVRQERTVRSRRRGHADREDRIDHRRRNAKWLNAARDVAERAVELALREGAERG